MDELENSVTAEVEQLDPVQENDVQDDGVKSEVADPKPAQTKEDNAAWKRARLAEEKTAKAEARAKKLGYSSFDEMEAELDRREQEELYQQAGIQDPKVIDQILSNHPLMQQAQKQLIKSRIIEEKAALKDQKYFKDLEADIDATLAVNPNLSVKDVFVFIRGEKMEELVAKETKSAATKAVDDHLRQSKRATEPSDSPASEDKQIDFTAAEKEWAERGVRRGTYKNLTEAWKLLRNK